MIQSVTVAVAPSDWMPPPSVALLPLIVSLAIDGADELPHAMPPPEAAELP